MKIYIILQRARPNNAGGYVQYSYPRNFTHLCIVGINYLTCCRNIFSFFALERSAEIGCCDQKRNPRARTPNSCGAGVLIISSSHAKSSLFLRNFISETTCFIKGRGYFNFVSFIQIYPYIIFVLMMA